MPTDNEELIAVKRSLDNLARVLAGASAMGDPYVRASRGGNAPVDSNNSTDRTEKAMSRLGRTNERLASASKNWYTAIDKAAGITKHFGLSASALVDKINNANSAVVAMTEQSKRITAETVKMIRTKGIESKAVTDMVNNTNNFNDTLRQGVHAARLRTALEETEKKLKEENNQLSLVTGKAARIEAKKRKAEIKKELAESVARRKTLSAEAAATGDKLAVLAATMDTDLIPAFKDLPQSIKDSMAAAKIKGASEQELSDLYAGLTDAMVAQQNAVEKMAYETEQAVLRMQQAREEIGKVIMNMGKGIQAVARMSIDNFRSQVAYNVEDSHYRNAADMGLSDGELSRFLGENADMLRNMAGSGDNTAMLDGTLQDLQRTTTALFGKSGPEAMKLLADAGGVLQDAGIALRDSPDALKAKLSSVSAMADRLGMVKEDLLKFQQEMGKAGELAYLGAKYQHMGGLEASAAMDRELEARIANAKMLGLSTEHVKKQIQLERANRAGTLENQIQKVIGNKMGVAAGKKLGVSASPEVQKLMELQIAGKHLDADEQRKVDEYKLAVGTAHNVANADAAARGDMSALYKLGGIKMIAGMSGGDLLSQENLDSADAQNALRKKYTPEEIEKFRADGTLSEVARKEMSGAGDPDFFGKIGQWFSRADTIKDGVMKNPLAAIGKDVGQIVWNTRIIAMNSAGGALGLAKSVAGKALSRTTMAGMASPLAGGGGLGGAARGFGANFTTAGASKLLKGSALLGGAFAGYDAFTSSTAKGESTGNAASSATGALIGGTGGAWAGAASGAAIGAIGGPIGMVLGATIFGALGAMGGGKLGEMVGDGIWDSITGEGDGPEAALERSRKEAEKARADAEKEKGPTEVVLAGQQGEALVATAKGTEAIAETSEKSLSTASKAHEFAKSRESILKDMDAVKTNAASSRARFANTDN